MSKENLIVFAVIALVVVIVFAIVIIARKAKGKGLAVLEAADSVLDGGLAIATAIKPFLPGISGTAIEFIIRFAKTATEDVEQEYKDNLDVDPTAPDTRQDDAIAMIKDGLKLMNVPITEDIEKLIEAVVPVAVRFLPKTHEPEETNDGAETPVAIDTLAASA